MKTLRGSFLSYAPREVPRCSGALRAKTFRHLSRRCGKWWQTFRTGAPRLLKRFNGEAVNSGEFALTSYDRTELPSLTLPARLFLLPLLRPALPAHSPLRPHLAPHPPPPL